MRRRVESSSLQRKTLHMYVAPREVGKGAAFRSVVCTGRSLRYRYFCSRGTDREPASPPVRPSSEVRERRSRGPGAGLDGEKLHAFRGQVSVRLLSKAYWGSTFSSANIQDKMVIAESLLPVRADDVADRCSPARKSMGADIAARRTIPITAGGLIGVKRTLRCSTRRASRLGVTTLLTDYFAAPRKWAPGRSGIGVPAGSWMPACGGGRRSRGRVPVAAKIAADKSRSCPQRQLAKQSQDRGSVGSDTSRFSAWASQVVLGRRCMESVEKPEKRSTNVR